MSNTTRGAVATRNFYSDVGVPSQFDCLPLVLVEMRWDSEDYVS